MILLYSNESQRGIKHLVYYATNSAEIRGRVVLVADAPPDCAMCLTFEQMAFPKTTLHKYQYYCIRSPCIITLFSDSTSPYLCTVLIRHGVLISDRISSFLGISAGSKWDTGAPTENINVTASLLYETSHLIFLIISRLYT